MYVTRLIVRFMRLFISYIAKRNFLAYKTHLKQLFASKKAQQDP